MLRHSRYVLAGWRASWLLGLAALQIPLASHGASTAPDPLIEFTRMRERCIVLSTLVRQKLPADSPALIQAQLLHADARALTNLWLDSIKSSLLLNEEPQKSPHYSARLSAAHAAAVTYMEHVEKLVLPPEAQTKFFPGADQVLLTLGQYMWQGFTSVHKRRGEERERARQGLLAEIESRKWPDFSAP